MWFRVKTFSIESKVFGKRMNKCSLPALHRFEAQSLLDRRGCEDTEFPLLRLSPFDVFGEYVESICRVRYVVASIDVSGLVDVQGQRKFPVPFQTRTFIIARQSLAVVAFTVFGSTALHLLLLCLAITSNEDFALTRLVLFAWEWSMAGILNIRVTAHFLLFSTWLLTRLSMCVFAFSRQVTGLQAVVRAAFQLLAADLPATNFLKPTLLILQSLLSAHATLLDQERAPGAGFAVLVTVMRDLWMAARLGPRAGVATWRWRRPTW